LRSIGSKDGVKPHIELSAITLVPGDAFLLCTDGFWEHVFENEMELDSVQTTGAEDWLSVMEERLLNRVLPGNDNYSAIAIRVF
jgi:serine/threonine protein phosphatase PrpC